MNTPSHFLMTALIGNRLKKNQIPVHGKAIALGSIIPDVSIFAFTLGYMAYRKWITPLPPGEHIFGPTYDNIYFQNPLMITAHNFFHAPFIITVLAIVGYFYGFKREKKWGIILFWFAMGCGFHSAVDIATHHNDGPLLFYPFNWQYRLITPISYWDPDHYGDIFAPLELGLDILIILYFVYQGWQKYNKQSSETI